MDRNSTLGLILITLLFLGFFYFSPTPTPPKQETADKAPTEVTAEAEDPQPSSTTESQDSEEAVSDSLRQARIKDRYSDFFPLIDQPGEDVRVETDKLTLVFDTKGGRIKAAYLNEYKTHDSLPLPVVAPNPDNKFEIEFAYKGREMSTSAVTFQPSAKELIVTGEDSATLVFKAPLDNGRSISFVYGIKGGAYDVSYRIQSEGIRADLDKGFLRMVWEESLPKTELDMKNMRAKTGALALKENSVEKVGPTDDKETTSLEYVKWISYKSQFFSHIIASDGEFRRWNFSMSTPTESDTIVRVMKSQLTINLPAKREADASFLMYFGPNEYQSLSSYDLEFEEEMDLGWGPIGWINKGTTYVFKFLEKYISNYGVIVILLAILIRLLMLPLSAKSYVSQAKMRVINQTPEIKGLDEKFKDDPQKLQMAKMNIYRESGVSMFGGCLPMLLSYPFLIALFFFFPQSVELRQQSFLWAHDLSTYDSILSWSQEIPLISSFYGNHVSLFTLLMAISTFIFTLFQQQSQPASANNQLKYVMYIMPLFLLVFLNNYASGLSLYYLTSNILQISQTLIIRRYFVDDEKLLAEMRAKQKASRKKNKGGKGGNNGKSGAPAAQGRVGKWLEKQQKKQEEMMKTRQQQAKGNNRSARRKK